MKDDIQTTLFLEAMGLILPLENMDEFWDSFPSDIKPSRRSCSADIFKTIERHHNDGLTPTEKASQHALRSLRMRAKNFLRQTDSALMFECTPATICNHETQKRKPGDSQMATLFRHKHKLHWYALGCAFDLPKFRSEHPTWAWKLDAIISAATEGWLGSAIDRIRGTRTDVVTDRPDLIHTDIIPFTAFSEAIIIKQMEAYFGKSPKLSKYRLDVLEAAAEYYSETTCDPHLYAAILLELANMQLEEAALLDKETEEFEEFTNNVLDNIRCAIEILLEAEFGDRSITLNFRSEISLPPLACEAHWMEAKAASLLNDKAACRSIYERLMLIHHMHYSFKEGEQTLVDRERKLLRLGNYRYRNLVTHCELNDIINHLQTKGETRS